VTERKRAEDELRKTSSVLESRTRELNAILTSVKDYLYIFDSQGRFVFANEMLLNLWGLSKEQAFGKTMHDLNYPESVENTLTLACEHVFRTKHPTTNETRYVNPTGTTGIYENILAPIIGPDGQVEYVVGSSRDITERKRAEEMLSLAYLELEKESARTRAIFESMAEGLVVADRDGNIIEMNSAGLSIHDFGSLDEIRRHLMEYPDLFEDRAEDGSLVPVEEWPMSKALHGEVFTGQELWVTRKDTGTKWIGRYSGAPVRDGDGNIIMAVITLEDITERKQAEQALRSSEARYSSLFQNMSEEVHFWEILRDEKGEISTWRLVDANPPALKTWGKELQEIKGKTTDEIFGPGATEHYLWVVRKIIAENTPYTFEDYFPHLDKHFRFTSIPMDDHFITTGADITAIKKAQENLERQVRERTAELEHANRAKDEFLANMSHEIRTPMSGVLGLTEILLHQDNLPDKVEADLEMIRSSSESVMTLINDLFDLSRISQGKFEFHPEGFDLHSMVRNAIRPFEFQARSMDLEFSVSVDESVPPLILCDKDRLGQVLKNLVSNAIKFTERGYVRVHVNAEQNDEDTLRLHFTVTDSGLGIPKSKQKEIFSAFTQLDPSYSKKFAGMGLGLAITKSLVKGMGGEISVDSTKGKGATFRFHVTCGIVTEEQEPKAPSITLQDLPPMTILLAEDNAVNRLFLRRALVTAGHEVGEAENGKHALAKLNDTHFDLVLMDIQMPEMDGMEATRRIRSGKHGRADIPIIALTAYAMKGDREKFLGNGMDGYVTKPVDFDELARTIAEVLGI
jgi:PAS domain S-box-containing protein